MLFCAVPDGRDYQLVVTRLLIPAGVAAPFWNPADSVFEASNDTIIQSCHEPVPIPSWGPVHRSLKEPGTSMSALLDSGSF